MAYLACLIFIMFLIIMALLLRIGDAINGISNKLTRLLISKYAAEPPCVRVINEPVEYNHNNAKNDNNDI